MKSLRVVDLFCGIGGLREGFTRACARKGISTTYVLSSDIKKSAVAMYESHFGDTVAGDVSKIDSATIPEFDFLLAGFPCQPFSSAGNRRGFEDTRGTLFYDVLRFLDRHKAAGFILENVPGLVTHDRGNTLSTITQLLKELGYSISVHLLSSSDYGSAQLRKRVYIIGTRNPHPEGVRIDSLYPNRVFRDVHTPGLPVECSDFTRTLIANYTLEGLQGKKIGDKRGGNNNIPSWKTGFRPLITKNQQSFLSVFALERRKKKWAGVHNVPWKDGMPLSIDDIKTFSPISVEELEDLTLKGYLSFKDGKYNLVSGKLSFPYTRILSLDEPVPTLVATDAAHVGVVDLKSKGLRKLTGRELLRLCDFEDDYNICVPEEQLFDLAGNSVSVRTVEAVAWEMLKWV